MFVGENSENPIVLSSDGSTGDSPSAKGFSMHPLEDFLTCQESQVCTSGQYTVPAPALFLLLTSIK